jgi:serine/threonine protein kinase/HEAT repeat protein
MDVKALSWVGKTLAGGRYRVTALLGEGGMGSVYRAHDANLDAEVVIKVPKAGLLADREFAARFGREVRSLVRLAHAHIVRVLDVGEHEGLPFAVMQFLAGGSLRERAARLVSAGPSAALADLAAWLPGVANALDYIHSQGYVHRDVKPDNILFDGIGHVCLGDFGIVKALAGAEEARTTAFQTTAGLVIGTPQYVAPELMVGGAASGAADQYALAVTAYEAVCGRLPFDGATAVALAVQHATRPAPPPHEVAAGVPLAFSMALLRGLHKEPAGRFPDCRSLAQALLAPLQALSTPSPANVEEAPRVVPARPPTPPPAGTAGTAEYPCPSCGTIFRLPPQPEGKQLRCRSCGTPFKVPPAVGGARADTDAVASAKMETVPPAPAAPSGDSQERFACPHCSVALRVPAAKRGRSMRCPRCKKSFVAGRTDPQSGKPAVSGTEPPASLPKRKGATAHLVVGALGSAALLVVAVGSLYWLFLRVPSPPTGTGDGKPGPVAQGTGRNPGPEPNPVKDVPPKKDPTPQTAAKPPSNPPEPPKEPPGKDPKNAADKLPADASVADLCTALRDEDAAVQELAAARLASLGPAAASAVADLARALEGSKVVAVRRNAAIALGRIGKDAKPAVPTLANALRSEPTVEVRRHAAEALAMIQLPHTKEALPALLESLDKDPDPLVCQRSLWALFTFPELSPEEQKDLLDRAKPILSAMLQEKAKEYVLVRYDAARMLASGWRADAPDGTADVLLDMLNNKTLRVFNRSDVKAEPEGAGQTSTEENLGGDARYMAAQALGWLGEKASKRPEVIAALQAAAEDKDVKLQEAARASLKALGLRE